MKHILIFTLFYVVALIVLHIHDENTRSSTPFIFASIMSILIEIKEMLHKKEK